MAWDSLTKVRYLLVAVAVVLLAALQVRAQEEGSGNSSVSIEPAAFNSTDTEAILNVTRNDRVITVEIHATGSIILDREDIDTCLNYAEREIKAYPPAAIVRRTRRPGQDLFFPYSTATVEVAGWMKGPEYPEEVTWGDLLEIVDEIKKYFREQASLEPIAAAGLIRGESFAYFALAATQRQAVASTVKS